jgi:hypothetical protein
VLAGLVHRPPLVIVGQFAIFRLDSLEMSLLYLNGYYDFPLRMFFSKIMKSFRHVA